MNPITFTVGIALVAVPIAFFFLSGNRPQDKRTPAQWAKALAFSVLFAEMFAWGFRLLHQGF